MLAPKHFGSGNYLSCAKFAATAKRRLLGVYDPQTIQQQLGVRTVQESVFPLILSGVRFWPYLLVANELRNCSKTETEKRLRAIRLLQRNESYSRDFGPLKSSTFSFYRRMHQRVTSSPVSEARDLRQLLTTRRRYRGKASFFTDNASNWRKALHRSMGTNSQQFARLLNRLHKKISDASLVDLAITELLKRPAYNGALRRAAFCYAFLRCVYGIRTRIEEIPAFVSNEEWAKLLSKLLQNPSADFREYSKFKRLIEKSIDEPALGHIHGKATRGQCQGSGEPRLPRLLQSVHRALTARYC
jgi:hypothetical protein